MTKKKQTRSVRHCREVLNSSVVLGLVFGLSACATIPFTEDTRPKSDTLTPGTIEYAIKYADKTRQAYHEKLRQESRHEQLLSSGMLTLGAAAIGAAAYGADMDVLFGLGLGGGLAYQLGTWNTSRDRLGIYVEGMKAMSCAKTAITPLRSAEKDANDISEKTNKLENEIEQTANAAARVTALLTYATYLVKDMPRLLTDAEAELAEVAGVFNNANGLLNRAASTRRKVKNAGLMLETKIDEMRTLIAEALNGTRADLSNLRGVIGSIGDYVNIFTPGVNVGSTLQNTAGVAVANQLETLQVPPNTHQLLGLSPDVQSLDASSAQARLITELSELRGKRVMLLDTMNAVKNDLFEPFSLDAVKSGLDRCGIDTSKFGPAIALNRTVVTFQPGKIGTALVLITGGTRPYTASLMDLPAKGVDLGQLAGSNTLVIMASEETEAGATHQIMVSDSANNSAILTVKIASVGAND